MDQSLRLGSSQEKKPANPYYQNREREKKGVWGGNPSLSVYHLSDLFRDPLEMPEAQARQPHSLELETENFSMCPFSFLPYRSRDVRGGALRDTHTVGSGRSHSLKQQQQEGTPSFFHS